MLSKAKMLSAMVGLTMLALPTAAFAGHGWHHGWRGGWHDRGWHNGWNGDDGDDDGGWHHWGAPGWRGGDDDGWRQSGYGCDDDCGGGRWNGYNGAYNNGYFPGGGYRYAAPAAPITPYPGPANPYGYGGYPYYGNTANAIGSIVGPLLGAIR